MEAVCQDEPVSRGGDAVIARRLDWPCARQRDGKGDGRVYQIDFAAIDAAGGNVPGQCVDSRRAARPERPRRRHQRRGTVQLHRSEIAGELPGAAGRRSSWRAQTPAYDLSANDNEPIAGRVSRASCLCERIGERLLWRQRSPARKHPIGGVLSQGNPGPGRCAASVSPLGQVEAARRWPYAAPRLPR